MVTTGFGRQGANVGVLDDVSVVELAIAIAAPSCARALAFHGADVVKIESRTNPDVMRLFGAVWAREMDAALYMDTSPYLGEMCANKRSVGLDLKQPDGREAALALLATTDVFITNYSTPAMRALGFGYEDIAAVNDDIVYVAMPGFGSDAAQPYYEYLAWGPNQAPLVGLDALTGYPDQEPAGIATIAPPDYFAGLHALTAVLTGLEHRDRTGEGAFIDIAQFETSVSCLGPFLFDNAMSGRTEQRSGNRLSWLAPQGCYPCRGDDAWVAITVGDDEQWQALAKVIGGAVDDARFGTLAGRLADHDELDELIGAWTSLRTAAEVASRLQHAAVAAYEVLDNVGVLHDPQVHDRHWFQRVASMRFPDGDVFGTHPIQLPETPGSWWRAGPSMGEDTVEVLTTRGGLSAAEVDALIERGTAFTAALPSQTLSRPYIDYADALCVHRTAR
jgi:benzylsuccinate CoA-transferase BbsF subunit